jgi:hypothetical protein
MIQEVRDAIVREIGQIDGLSVLPYLGQLADPAKPDIDSHAIPAVLVDFVGDENDGQIRTMKFNLYIVHVTYSANKEYRNAAHAEVYQLLEAIDGRLRKMTDAQVFPEKSRKIFDNNTAKGYLTVFTLAISAQIIDQGVHTWSID